MIHIRDEELLNQFGIQLRKIRLEQGFTQRSLAFKADVSLSQISRLERGLLNPTLSTLSVLSKALDVSLAQLLDFDFPK